MKQAKQLLFIVILISISFFPQIVFAQLTPDTTVKGNRVILTEEQASPAPQKESKINFNKNKVVYVFSAIGLLTIAGFGIVQLIGPSKKPKIKE